MIFPRRRDVLTAGAASLFVPRRALAAAAGAETVPGATPAAIAGTGWRRKSEWNFGTAAGNIRRFTDWLAAGWFMDETPRFLNDECQTYNTTVATDGNLNFMPFADHCDIVAIWNGGPIASAQGNGAISSLMLRYNVPSPNAIGYYELTCKIPAASGAWPAWWTVGHAPGTPQGSYTWGPEVDIFEFQDTKTGLMYSTLHGGTPQSRSFLPGGGYPPGKALSPAARYEGGHPWNLGDFIYQPGTDFARDYHRFGLRIAPNYAISIWVDDVGVGEFGATHYADDRGNPVGVELLINLALGTHNPDPIHSIHTADFGGVGNRGPANKFRLSLRNIQLWGPG